MTMHNALDRRLGPARARRPTPPMSYSALVRDRALGRQLVAGKIRTLGASESWLPKSRGLIVGAAHHVDALRSVAHIKAEHRLHVPRQCLQAIT